MPYPSLLRHGEIGSNRLTVRASATTVQFMPLLQSCSAEPPFHPLLLLLAALALEPLLGEPRGPLARNCRIRSG